MSAQQALLGLLSGHQTKARYWRAFSLSTRNRENVCASDTVIKQSEDRADTCPDTCPLKENGCYGEYGPLRLQWARVTDSWHDFLKALSRLPTGQIWRHNQAGDLPGNGDWIDPIAMAELVKASAGTRGFTFTHKPVVDHEHAAHNAHQVTMANKAGFTVSLSADTLGEADKLAALNIAPVVTVLTVPIGTRAAQTTPAGRKVAICPATYRRESEATRLALGQPPANNGDMADDKPRKKPARQGAGMIVGYARTSTAEQKAGLDGQIRDLEAAGATKIFKEQISSVAKRDQLDACLNFLREDDVLMVTKPDRLARSTKELLEIVDDLTARQIGLVILSMNGERLDTRNPTSKMMLTILGAVATWEREIMLERQREGIAKAASEGKYKGRKPTARAKSADVLRLIAEGKTREAVAEELGIGVMSVYRILAADKKAASTSQAPAITEPPKPAKRSKT
jgi:DNA invertase Pin-like site-specific DNA recombinase